VTTEQKYERLETAKDGDTRAARCAYPVLLYIAFRVLNVCFLASFLKLWKAGLSS
jgi:hypothetical protein